MATYNFTESGNYIYIDKSDDDGNYNGAKADVRAFIVGKVTPTQVQFSGLLASPQTGNQNNRFLLSECEIGGVAATEESMQTFIDDHTGGKPSAGDSALIYEGYLSQSGTDAPTIDWIGDVTGETTEYQDAGNWKIVKEGAFIANKTFFESFVFRGNDSSKVCSLVGSAVAFEPDAVEVFCFRLEDSIAYNDECQSVYFRIIVKP